MKFIVDTLLRRRFEVEARSEKKARDIIESADLETLKLIDGDFEIEDIFRAEKGGD